jgi:hypothetical protein
MEWVETVTRQKGECEGMLINPMKTDGLIGRAGQVQGEFARKGPGDGRDSHLPGVDQIGMVLHAFAKIELILGRLVDIEIEEVVAALLPGAQIVSGRVV